MRTQKIDYIIVGQGLAGSCVALHLLFRKKKILVIDRFDDHSATQVAAGLFNPITGKKLSKTWMADELFPFLHRFYSEAERFTESQFFHSLPVYRPFVSAEEQNEWMGRSSDGEFSNYLESVFTSQQFIEHIHNPLGGLLLKQCGYLDTVKFTRAVRQAIEQENTFLNEIMPEEELKIESGSINYLQWTASKIIFCNGVKSLTGRFFSWLPIQPLKGETLTLETKEEPRRIYNRGVYVVPDPDNYRDWKVGATYDFKDVTGGVTEQGRKELTEALKLLIRFPYIIKEQSWGFRPTVPDRRPILGAHPEFENVSIFNGLGTKGVSLAPYFSEVLINWLENGQPLNNAVDIKRYKSLYWKSA